MRLFKKVAALLLAVAIAVPTTAFGVAASTSSPSELPIKGTKATSTYNGSDQSALIKFTDENGTVLTKGTDYKITNITYVKFNYDSQSGTNLKVKNAGIYTIKATGIGSYTGTATTKITINKAKATLSVSKTAYSYSYLSQNGKALSIQLSATTNSNGKISYYCFDSPKNAGYSISNTGLITHGKSGYTANSYNFYVKVKASTNYEASDRVPVKVTIRKSYPHIGPDSPRTKTVKAKAIAKKSYSYKLGLSGEPGTSLKYAVVGSTAKKYIKVSSSGKVTVAKGTPKGKYRIHVWNTNTTNYYKGTKNYYVKVK